MAGSSCRVRGGRRRLLPGEFVRVLVVLRYGDSAIPELRASAKKNATALRTVSPDILYSSPLFDLTLSGLSQVEALKKFGIGFLKEVLPGFFQAFVRFYIA